MIESELQRKIRDMKENDRESDDMFQCPECGEKFETQYHRAIHRIDECGW